MKLDFGYGEQEVICSITTLMVYEQEFKRDLIQDLFGRMVLRDETEEEGEFVLDFRDTNWTALIRVLWAALKTADDSLPPFAEWQANLEDVNLYIVQGVLVPEVQRRFFRAGGTGSRKNQ